MSAAFDYFVIFAEMRTGSNFLESNLNAAEGVQSFGEAFNPHFIGYPNKSDILGISQKIRDENPMSVIWAIRENPGVLGGFRFFHDHDERVLDACLNDPRCAKIILTRNPIESYVSWKIAQTTGQWKLTNVKRRKDGMAQFDKAEFEAHLAKLQGFQLRLLKALQTTGQTAFYVGYEDLQDVSVMNGLLRFLGIPAQLDALDASLKKQNPSPLTEKVSNFGEMEHAIAGLDLFDLNRTPNFEPRRGAAVPGFVTGAKAPLLFMPIRSGPEQSVLNWLAALDGVTPDTLPTQMNQKRMRQWKRRNRFHRSFTVIRHPLARAHAVFCRRILSRGPGSFAEIRKTLRNFHKLPIPGGQPGPDYTAEQHKIAFAAFLEFLGANLSGQTNIRVDANWASQAEILQGMSNFCLPDVIVREQDAPRSLNALGRAMTRKEAPAYVPESLDQPYSLADIYDPELEALAERVYQRDYLMFGFGPWRQGKAA